MALPTNRQQFKDFVLRQLGAPVIQIEMADEQIEDNIDMALAYFREYHSDGMNRTSVKYTLTQEDIDNGYIQVPENIYGVSRIAPITTFDYSYFKYQMILSTLSDVHSQSLIPYYITSTHLSLLDDFFATYAIINYNYSNNRLTISNMSNYKAGTILVLESYVINNPNESTKIWSDRWLIRYATAIIKRQWALHLKKFNVTLIGNVTFNASEMYNEADTDIKTLEEELLNQHSLPPFDMIG